MGRTALSASILRFFVAALCAMAPVLAQATATAQGVALNSAAGCITADLDLTVTTAGATTELWQATTLSGQISGGSQVTTPANYAVLPVRIGIPLSPQPPPNTLIGSYVRIGDALPSAATTAEFFVYYNCSTRQVLLACYGPYGSCPQTATQAAARFASQVPGLSGNALAVAVLLVAAAGALALSRRRI